MSTNNLATPTLPAGILASDLKYVYTPWTAKTKPHPLPYEDQSFELWNVTGYGWCIPTLQIAKASRRRRSINPGVADRTYAIRISDKSPCRIGFGPHVTSRVTVYVSAKRAKALLPFIELRRQGAITANQIRDRISSRRAQGALRRARFFGDF